MKKRFKIFSNPYFPTSISLYVNFFIHGMGVITIAQNMNYLMVRYGTDEAGVAGVLSGMGLGRFFSYFIVGFLSDRFGRKPMVLMGAAFYIMFFMGILLSTSPYMAFMFAILGGMANACLDTGTYPALMESYPRTAGTAVVTCKAAIAFGQMFYPLIVGFLISNQMWFGWALVIPAVLIFINALAVRTKPFPEITNCHSEEDAKLMPCLKCKPGLIDRVLPVCFGFFVYSTFHTILIWMPKFAEKAAGMPEAAALRTISFYSIGALVCVFISGMLVRRLVRHVLVMTVLPSIAAAAALAAYFFPTPAMCNVVAFVIGFCAAGGLLQLGIAAMSEFFPYAKASMTSVYMLFGSLSNFSIPLITGAIFKINVGYIMLFDAAMGIAAAVSGLLMLVRYYGSFIIPAEDLRLGERLLSKR